MSLTIFGGSVEFVTGAGFQVRFTHQGPFADLDDQCPASILRPVHAGQVQRAGAESVLSDFGMCGESFSINCTADVPKGVDRGWFLFFVTLLNHVCWVVSATVGGLHGSWLQLNPAGLEFAMTALFVLIFLERLEERRGPFPLPFGPGVVAFLPGSVSGDRLYPPGNAPHIRRVHAAERAPGESSGCAAMMTPSQQIITIGMVVLGTVITLFLPFFLYSRNRPTPKFIQELGTRSHLPCWGCWSSTV